jgi:hypothetical protein
VALVACGSSSKTTSTTAASSGSATTAAPAGGSGGSSDASQLQALTASVQAAEHGTFKAVYTSVNANGTNATVTIEQMPPKTLFSTGQGDIIFDGSKTYYCSNGGKQCVVYGAGAANPLAALTNLFSPATAVTALQQAEGYAAAKTAGYNVSFSSQTFAGQSSKCVSGNGSQGNFKYCITNSGILAYGGGNGNSFSLTSYSSSVSSSDFSLPAGATVITLPGGG